MQSTISLYSYGFACLTYTILSGALLLVWRHRSFSLAAVLGTIITAGWAGTLAFSSLSPQMPTSLLQAVEVSRNTIWIFVLLAIYGGRLRGTGHILSSRGWFPWFMAGLALIVVVLFATPVLATLFRISEQTIQSLIYSIWLSMTIIGVLLLENIYRNSSEDDRWWTKYLCIAIGFVFFYDFFMYTQALTLQRLDPVLWQSRGFAIAFTAPLLAVAAARSNSRRGKSQLSRHVVFHTFTLLAAGLYLIFMAIVGFFVNYLGGSWSGVLQITYLSASGLFFVTMLASRRMRALSQVWLSKNFFSYKYDYRREWLNFTETLEEGEGNTPRAIIQAMVKLAHCRGGLLLARTESGGFDLKDFWQLDAPNETAHYPSFYKWLQDTGWIIDVEEWRASPEIYIGLQMPDLLANAPGAWMVVPLMFRKRLEGVLILRRVNSNDRFNWEDRDLIKVAGREAASHLAQCRASEALVESRQFEAFSRLSAYVIHDLKNILSQQSLIVSNSARHRGNLEFFDEVIDTVSNSVERMTDLMHQMESGMRGSDPESLDLSSLLEEVVTARKKTLPWPILTPPAQKLWVAADRQQLSTVFGHIIQNAKDATDRHGKIAVRLLYSNERAVVEVQDTGCGMSQEFIKTRLFKPFESTKGLTGMGIGAFESREFVRSIGGDILVKSKEGVGSCFRIVLPCIEPQSGIPGSAEATANG
jgi:putative PEP-CTERM system histidine kinase